MAARRLNATGAGALPGPVFEFCVVGRAVSMRSRNRIRLTRWMATVVEAARATWPQDRAAIETAIEVRISEFTASPSLDRDNLAKPVLDALQQLAYLDDRQVMALTVEWCDIEAPYVVRYISPVIAAALSAGAEFLWIRIYDHVARKELTR